MPPTPYRLDTVAASLVERLEGARRTWMGQPDAAREGMTRIANETLDLVIAEHDRIMPGTQWSEMLRRELLETFLPRYVRLAVAHNALEAAGYGAWRQGDPLARVMATGGMLMAAVVIERLLHHPITIVLFIFSLFVPALPEIRAWYHRRQYAGVLQDAVDDMGRIQDELDRFIDDDIFTDERLQAARDKVEAARTRQKEQTLR
ncbi:MAG: hypothetical protein P8R54_23640 [Myxococcota bacterium]|nr:hypothetical protein [Myxococcota bacterium]